jgi:undecaprenyl-diphosphatase
MALTISGDLLTAIVKGIVARPRPTPDLIAVYRAVSGYSFPSGHVLHYVVFFGALGYLGLRTLRRTPSEQRWRRLALFGLLAVCSGLILLVGASRLFLGAHWPTDVLGGYVLGSAWLLLLIASQRSWLRVQTKPDTSANQSEQNPTKGVGA